MATNKQLFRESFAPETRANARDTDVVRPIRCCFKRLR